ncbi:hypothetical protein [Cupriavidus necator]
MPRNFTDAERLVAMAVSANPTDTANENDVDAGGYMGPIADAILRDDLSDAAMSSLGRELLQVYQRDVIGLVLSTEREIDEEETERLSRTQRALAEMPAAVTFRLH